ncbi:YeeE/YedE family protein [Rhodopseudomonas sp. B29]|uniref:YeeE/YedE family protein n=1 Tax=Rhodopseudomonas sp. B29 TaxID=95607 RepID=UPI0003B780DD|nr:YeeE/YedE family protein [Rhodopseudomonas sp. B29]
MSLPTLARLAIALIAGAIFGFGLSLSGMVDPARVLGFLDLASGHWDPSLMFVLGGAVLVALPGVALQRRMAKPALDREFHLPATNTIDRRLVVGLALVGIGWGLAGFCPDRQYRRSRRARRSSRLFVVTMAAGMLLHDRLLGSYLR